MSKNKKKSSRSLSREDFVKNDLLRQPSYLDVLTWWLIYFLVLLPVRFLFYVICPPLIKHYWHNGSIHHLAQDGYPVYEGVEVIATDLPYGDHTRETFDVLGPSKNEIRYGNDCSTWPKVFTAIATSLPDIVLAYPKSLMSFFYNILFSGMKKKSYENKKLIEVRKRKAVLFIHGGGFVAVDPCIQHHQLTCFVREGYVVYAMSYPLAPESIYPSSLISTLKALSWLKTIQNHEEILIVGESAGGSLATAAAGLLMNPKALNEFGMKTRKIYDATYVIVEDLYYPKIVGVVSWYGVLDNESWRDKGFLSWGLKWTQKTYLGQSPYPLSLTEATHRIKREDLKLREDCDFIDVTRALKRNRIQNYPPLLLVSGTADPLGLAHSSRLCLQEIKAKVPSCRVILKEYDAGHAFIGLNPFVLWALQGSFGWKEYAYPATMETLKFCRECFS